MAYLMEIRVVTTDGHIELYGRTFRNLDGAKLIAERDFIEWQHADNVRRVSVKLTELKGHWQSDGIQDF